MNPTLIESHAKLVLLQWMIIIAAAWLFGRLGKKVGQPLANREILAGIVLGRVVHHARDHGAAHHCNDRAVVAPLFTQGIASDAAPRK